MEALEQEWIKGEITLGAAANWSADEIRLVSELGYALAQQGRNTEAIAVFEGLAALSPATHYFDSALGALWLREAAFERAILHLNSALSSDPDDISNRVNRAEALIHEGQLEQARNDLDFAFDLDPNNKAGSPALTRAKALRDTLTSK